MAQNKAFKLGGIGHPCCCASSCTTTICAKSAACGSFTTNIVGATVQIKTGATVIASGTTTSPLGCVVLTIPAAGSYTVVVAASGYPTNTSTKTLSCGGTTTISFGLTDINSVCCKSLVPIPLTVFFTVCGTTISLVWNSGSSLWNGAACISTTGVSKATVAGGCIGPAPGTGNAELSIQFTCANVNPAANTITFLGGAAGTATVTVPGPAVALADCASDISCPNPQNLTGTIVGSGTLSPLSLTGTSFTLRGDGGPAPCAGVPFTLTG